MIDDAVCTPILYMATYPTRYISEVFNELDCEVGPPDGLVTNFVAAFDVWSCWPIEDENKDGRDLKEMRKAPFGLRMWIVISHSDTVYSNPHSRCRVT